MTMHIVMNGREVNSPVAKWGLVVGSVLVAALIAAMVVFVLLPLVGIAVTLSAGFVLVVMAAVLVGLLVLALGSVLFAALFGPLELLVDKLRRPRP